MERSAYMLAAMSPADMHPFSPVQVQKLFFILDRNLFEDPVKRYFGFQPYDYGPFDKAVYAELEALAKHGWVEIMVSQGANPRTYRLTFQGQKRGAEGLKSFPEATQQYMQKVVRFVHSLSFAQLVSSIYQAYPDMKRNSVFFQEAE